jgi:hypothetical protein
LVKKRCVITITQRRPDPRHSPTGRQRAGAFPKVLEQGNGGCEEIRFQGVHGAAAGAGAAAAAAVVVLTSAAALGDLTVALGRPTAARLVEIGCVM